MRALDNGDILNPHNDLVARISEPGVTTYFDGRVVYVNKAGFVTDEHNTGLGRVHEDGAVFNTGGRKIGISKGDHALEAAAALLGLQAETPPTYKEPKKPRIFQRAEPDVVVRYRFPEPDSSDGEFNIFTFGIWALIGMMLCFAVIAAAIFVALTSPIWGGMAIVTLVATTQLIRRQADPDERSSWFELKAVKGVKRDALVASFAYGALVASIITFIARDLGVAAACLGATVLGILVSLRVVDKHGTKVANRLDPKDIIVPTASSPLASMSRYIGYGSAATFSLFCISAIVAWKFPANPSSQRTVSTYVASSSATVPSSTQFNSSSSAPSASASVAGDPGGQNTPPFEAREVVAEGDTPSFKLVAYSIEDRKIWIPEDYPKAVDITQKDGTRTYRWTKDDGFFRVDVSKQFDPVALLKEEETRFKSSKRYQYERKRVRMGKEAYLGGVIWNFRLKKDSGPWMKRTIAYVNADGKTFAVAYGSPDTGTPDPNGSRKITEVFNSLNAWSK